MALSQRDEVVTLRADSIRNLLDTDGWRYVEEYLTSTTEGHRDWLLSVEASDEPARIERERRLAVYKAWTGFRQVLQDWIRQGQETNDRAAREGGT